MQRIPRETAKSLPGNESTSEERELGKHSQICIEHHLASSQTVPLVIIYTQTDLFAMFSNKEKFSKDWKEITKRKIYLLFKKLS